jgi:hypothetical protein
LVSANLIVEYKDWHHGLPSRADFVPMAGGIAMAEAELAEATTAVIAQIARQLAAVVVPAGADPLQLLAPAAR